MFDNMQITKSYKVLDNINNINIDVCTFNATLNRESGINMNLNIAYPNLYQIKKDEILDSYRSFSAEVTALAVTMGLASRIDVENTVLDNLNDLKEELETLAKETFKQVIGSLGNITVNPVPSIESSMVGYPSYR